MRYFIDPPATEINPRFPCGICTKNVNTNHKAVQCDLCNYHNHIKCDGIDNKTYEILVKSDDSVLHYCKLCKEYLLSNHFLTTNILHQLLRVLM